MKSQFNKGDVVKTNSKTNRMINKGRIKNLPVISSGIVLRNEHFDRFVCVKVGKDDYSVRPEYLESA